MNYPGLKAPLTPLRLNLASLRFSASFVRRGIRFVQIYLKYLSSDIFEKSLPGSLRFAREDEQTASPSQDEPQPEGTGYFKNKKDADKDEKRTTKIKMRMMIRRKKINRQPNKIKKGRSFAPSFFNLFGCNF